jgi:hypothetical protein
VKFSREVSFSPPVAEFFLPFSNLLIFSFIPRDDKDIAKTFRNRRGLMNCGEVNECSVKNE